MPGGEVPCSFREVLLRIVELAVLQREGGGHGGDSSQKSATSTTSSVRNKTVLGIKQEASGSATSALSH